jgi:hypothetical protein
VEAGLFGDEIGCFLVRYSGESLYLQGGESRKSELWVSWPVLGCGKNIFFILIPHGYD